MEVKDTLYVLGLLSTFIVSFFSLYISYHNNKSKLYTDIITSERIRRIEKLRNDVSTYCGRVHYFVMTDIGGKDKQEILKELDYLGYLIKLLLSHSKEKSQKLIELLDAIPDAAHRDNYKDCKKLLAQLHNEAGEYIEKEWDKVETEAIHGVIRKKISCNFRLCKSS